MLTNRVASALTLVFLHGACGGDVQRNSAGPPANAVDPNDAGGIDAGPSLADARNEHDPPPDPCSPENRPVCATLRERVVYSDAGDCALYVPHSAGDPRPFDPNVLAIQIPTASGPRKVTFVSDASGCTGGVLAWHFEPTPPRMVFCPPTCNVIRTEASDVVELLLSCAECPPPA